MSVIDTIKKPIRAEMQLFADIFAESISTDNRLLLRVNEYIRQKSGKQFRPMLTLLSAKMCGEVTRNTLLVAQSLELLHTASLIHDDIIDDTLERRGKPSVHARWTNKIAVFSGDYLFSKALSCATETADLTILKAVSNIGSQLTDGELLQLVNTQPCRTSEENYFTIIRKKTAQLFSSCAELGALSAYSTDQQLSHLRNFGEYVGMSFQLKDDIFDYAENIQLGKPTGNDIRDGKVTLPLIYALQHGAEKERDNIMALLDNAAFSTENVRSISRFAHDNGGIDYATQAMESFRDSAIKELAGFENSDVKQSLILCAEYAASRES